MLTMTLGLQLDQAPEGPTIPVLLPILYAQESDSAAGLLIHWFIHCSITYSSLYSFTIIYSFIHIHFLKFPLINLLRITHFHSFFHSLLNFFIIHLFTTSSFTTHRPQQGPLWWAIYVLGLRTQQHKGTGEASVPAEPWEAKPLHLPSWDFMCKRNKHLLCFVHCCFDLCEVSQVRILLIPEVSSASCFLTETFPSGTRLASLAPSFNLLCSSWIVSPQNSCLLGPSECDLIWNWNLCRSN